MGVEPILGIRAAVIHTLEERRPYSECLAVGDGRILAVGNVEEVEAGFPGQSIDWVDLRPGIIFPGLCDSHIHLTEWALGLSRPDLAGAESMQDALARIGEVAASVEPHAWIEFKGWDPAWRRQASLRELDAAAAGRAVALIGHDLHSGWLGSEAMRRLGIGPDRADPPGGRVERDESGMPTGLLEERALEWWYEGRPEASEVERRSAILSGQKRLHGLGVTAVHSVEAPSAFASLESLARAGDLRLRVLHHFPQRFIDSLLECRIPSGFGGAWLRVGGIKYFTDGALGSQTAWMLEPYERSKGRGIRRLEPDELRRDVARSRESGLSATVHAIGDAAVRMTLDVLEEVGDDGLAVPHRIEHLQCVHPDDLPRVARSGTVASMQPSHMLTDIRLAEERWGDRSRGAFALRSLLKAGTTFAFGSDAPVERPDPREGFYAARFRQDRSGYPRDGWYPAERLTGSEVLEAYTVGAATAAGEAGRRGRLFPGYDADFVAWDSDLTSIEGEEILEASVLATMVGGELVYRAG